MNLPLHIITILTALVATNLAAALPSEPYNPTPAYDSDYWLTVMAFQGPSCQMANFKPDSSLFHNPQNSEGQQARYITGTCYPVTDVVGSVILLEGARCTASFWSGNNCQGWNWRKTPGIPCIDLTWGSMRVWCWDGPLYGPCGGKAEANCQARRDVANYTISDDAASKIETVLVEKEDWPSSVAMCQ